MNSTSFFDTLAKNPRPVVVDLWAPWCGPCKVVKPILEKLASEYSGRVDLWQINADDNPDLLRELKVYGIPTLIVYRAGKEIKRQVGAKPAAELKALFEALARGEDPAPAGMSVTHRFTRMAAGLAFAGIGWVGYNSWVMVAIGAALMFSAVYDRCPIWRAVTNQFKKMSGRA